MVIMHVHDAIHHISKAQNPVNFNSPELEALEDSAQDIEDSVEDIDEDIEDSVEDLAEEIQDDFEFSDFGEDEEFDNQVENYPTDEAYTTDFTTESFTVGDDE